MVNILKNSKWKVIISLVILCPMLLLGANFIMTWPVNPSGEQVIGYNIIEYNGTNYTVVGFTSETNFTIVREAGTSSRFGIAATNSVGQGPLSELVLLPGSTSDFLVISRTSNNLPKIRFSIPANRNATLQYSYNLSNWINLASFFSPTNYDASFVDTSSTVNNKFYRLMLED